MVIERLDGTYMEGDPETGQYPLYGKAAGVIVTGNEDGAHDVSVQLYSSALPTWAVPCLQMQTVIGLVMQVPARVI